MENRHLIYILIVFLLIFFLIGNNWRTANVSLELQQDYYVSGENITDGFVLSLDKKDIVQKDTPILIALSKNNEVLFSDVLTIEEFVLISGKEPNTFEENGEIFYTGEGIYEVSFNRLIDYNLNETGEYEFFFSLIELDLNINEKIIVD